MNHVGHLALEESQERETATKEDIDRYKDTRKAYYKFVSDGKYADALKLVGDVFKFTEGLAQYFCGYDIRVNDKSFFVTHSEVKDAAWIEINTGAMSHFGTATRMLFHEWHHIRQNYVFLKTNWIYGNHEFREWDAYTQTLNNSSLPDAESTQTQYWSNRRNEYWNKVPMHIQTTYLRQILLMFQLIR